MMAKLLLNYRSISSDCSKVPKKNTIFRDNLVHSTVRNLLYNYGNFYNLLNFISKDLRIKFPYGKKKWKQHHQKTSKTSLAFSFKVNGFSTSLWFIWVKQCWSPLKIILLIHHEKEKGKKKKNQKRSAKSKPLLILLDAST